jgi:hypothetical protein
MTGIIISGFFLAMPVQAEEEDWKARTDIDAKIRLQYITEDNPDLTTDREDRENSVSEQLEVSVYSDISDNFSAYARVRGLNIDGESGFDDDTGKSETVDESFLEIRQLWGRFEHIAGVVPLYIQAGKQRLREPRALWWNSNNDLVKVAYDGTITSGFIAVGENLNSYRTNTDSDFEEDDEDRFRILGEASWQYSYDHFVEGRFLYEMDHSGTEPAGSFLDPDNRDREDNNALWAGVRLSGNLIPKSAFVKTCKYRVDLVGLTGETEELESRYIDENTRMVTGSTERDLRAWAFDGGLIIFPDIIGKPAVTFGYAYGSGDDDPDDNTDNAFRQTGLEGNSSRIGLERTQRKNYGEVLRPELSNLHIAYANIDIPISKHSDTGATYFYYHLDEKASDLRSDGITARMTGDNKSVGQEVDLFLNIGIDEEFGIKIPKVRDIDFRVAAGGFFPGDAYDIEGEKNVYRIFTELKFRF